MTWNYRVIEFAGEGGESYRAIHEVYYSADGKPEGYTERAVGVQWQVSEGDESGLRTLDRMREAFRKPFLTPDDFLP